MDPPRGEGGRGYAAEGMSNQVTVEHDLGHRIGDQAIARLRTLFPEATVATQAAAVPS